MFGYHVSDPERYGVVGFDEQGRANSIAESLKSLPIMRCLYCLDGRAPALAAKLIRPLEGS